MSIVQFMAVGHIKGLPTATLLHSIIMWSKINSSLHTEGADLHLEQGSTSCPSCVDVNSNEPFYSENLNFLSGHNQALHKN